MSDNKGRAYFRVTHGKVGGKFPKSERGSNADIVREALRSLDPEQSRLEAKKNRNIIVSEEWRNQNWVSDGNGGMAAATSFEEPLGSLEARNKLLYRKQATKDYELSLLVVHLPKTLCVEDQQNTVYVLNDDGQPVISKQNGKPLTKPRLIPRDYDEARKYFDDALSYLIEVGIIRDGYNALHFRSDQYSEHRPHMQIAFDNYAPHPDHDGYLRNENSHVWFTHDEVRYGEKFKKAGSKIGGSVKMRSYQTGLREYMVGRGWPVEMEINPRTAGNSQGKNLYAATDDARIIAEDRLAASEILQSQAQSEMDAALEIKRRNADRSEKLDARESQIGEQEAEILAAAQSAKRDAEVAAASARAESVRLHALREEIEHDLAIAGPVPQLPSYEETRAEILAGQSHIMTNFLKEMKRKDGTTMLDDFEQYARREHRLLQERSSSAPSFDVWRNRTVAAQKKITIAKARAVFSNDPECETENGYDLGG